MQRMAMVSGQAWMEVRWLGQEYKMRQLMNSRVVLLSTLSW